MLRFLEKMTENPLIRCVLWVAGCFSLTSAAWLSWEYHLLTRVDPGRSDSICMIGGYLFQAGGAALGAYLIYRLEARKHSKAFCGVVILFFLFLLPALYSQQTAVVIGFGLLMNLLCGGIAAFYLFGICQAVPASAFGRAFGCGYGLSTLFVYLLSLPGQESFLQNGWVMVVYLLLGGGMIGQAVSILRPAEAEKKAEIPAVQEVPDKKTWTGALLLIFLMSLTKNLGFGFPASDFELGVNVEFSRLFYAIGLIAAGFLCDRNRKTAALCAAAALVLPFVMLSLTAEPVPLLVCWGLDYCLFGFFSVFRVVCILDFAVKSQKEYLAPLGLLAGRVGDAAGTLLYGLLNVNRIALIIVALFLFAGTLFFFFRLYARLFMPKQAERQRSEQEVFEEFSIRHDLSAREKDVLRLLLATKSNTEIADALFVSESTAKYHVHNLLRKTGSKSRQELVKKYNLTLFPHIGDNF